MTPILKIPTAAQIQQLRHDIMNTYRLVGVEISSEKATEIVASQLGEMLGFAVDEALRTIMHLGAGPSAADESEAE